MHKIQTFRRNLATRVRQVRAERFGRDEEGIHKLSESLGLPPQTWVNYEDGVTMPAEVLLRFIDLTGIDWRWLMTGEGERYSLPAFTSKFGLDRWSW